MGLMSAGQSSSVGMYLQIVLVRWLALLKYQPHQVVEMETVGSVRFRDEYLHRQIIKTDVKIYTSSEFVGEIVWQLKQ